MNVSTYGYRSTYLQQHRLRLNHFEGLVYDQLNGLQFQIDVCAWLFILYREQLRYHLVNVKIFFVHLLSLRHRSCHFFRLLFCISEVDKVLVIDAVERLVIRLLGAITSIGNSVFLFFFGLADCL